MTPDELKALALKIVKDHVEFSKQEDNGFENAVLHKDIADALERVQRETLAARIKFPQIVEYKATGSPHEIALGVYDWLLANIKFLPNEPVSDEEVIARAHECKRSMHPQADIGALYVQGWRACEKKLRGSDDRS